MFDGLVTVYIQYPITANILIYRTNYPLPSTPQYHPVPYWGYGSPRPIRATDHSIIHSSTSCQIRLSATPIPQRSTVVRCTYTLYIFIISLIIKKVLGLWVDIATHRTSRAFPVPQYKLKSTVNSLGIFHIL